MKEDNGPGPSGTSAASKDALRDQILREMAIEIRAISRTKGWSLWAADYMDPDVDFVDVGMPSTGAIVQELRRLDRAAVLREAADAIYALPPDYECDPGRGDAADLLRRMADETEEKDTPASGATSTARAQILAALQAAGHTADSAAALLAQADREPRVPDPDPDFRECLGGGHALVVEYGDCELLGSCQCGKPFGATAPDASLDTFAGPWERHTNTEVT